MVRAFDPVGELEIRSSADEAHREPGFLDLTGREIGRYRIQQRLGRGGVTTVYQAYDSVDDIPVALKVLLHGSDTKLYNRFRQEAQTAAKLRHPHIVRTLRVGVTPGSDTAYIAMELVEGEDLAALLSRQRRLSPEESCQLLEPIAHALAYAHTQNIVHRDVKPSNILLRSVGADHTASVVLETLDYPVVPLLGDFGIARALDLPELTSWGRTVGTPAFMAPEQARGARDVDHRADIYALGAVFYRCLTGRQPFSGTTVQILHSHVYDSVTISEEIQRNLSQRHFEILQRTLAKNPDDRYASAGELASALARGTDPTTDRLSNWEREDERTATLEIQPPAARPVSHANQTVIVPGENYRGHGLSSATAAATAPIDAGRHSGHAGENGQLPLDPHFNAALDEKLQGISGIVLSILVTIIAGAIFYIVATNILYSEQHNPQSPAATPTLHAPAMPTASGFVPHIEPLGKRDTASSSALSIGPVGRPNLSAGSPINGAHIVPDFSLPTAVVTVEVEAPQALAALPVSASLNGEHDGDHTPGEGVTEGLLIQEYAVPAVTNQENTSELQAIPTSSLSAPLGENDRSRQQRETSEPHPSSEDAMIYAPCTVQTHALLRPLIAEMDATMREQFHCAMQDPIESGASLLSFEGGEMLYLQALNRIFISYKGYYQGIDAPWTLVYVPLPDLLPPLTDTVPTAPEDLHFNPTGIFGIVWEMDANRTTLGLATTPQPVTITIVAQQFTQGWLVAQWPPDHQGDVILNIFPATKRAL